MEYMSDIIHSDIEDGNTLEACPEEVLGDADELPRAIPKGGVCLCPYCSKAFLVGEERGTSSIELRCNKCGSVWKSRKGTPLKCPSCGSYAWNKATLECRCHVCGYEWLSRKEGGPSRCPNCKSSRWMEDPVHLKKKVVKKKTSDVTEKWVMDKYSAGKGCMDIAIELGLPVFRVMTIVKTRLGLDSMPVLTSEKGCGR